MTYNQSDIDMDINAGFGSYEGEIVKAGVGINKNYNSPVMTLVCRPADPSRRSQTLSYSMGKKPFEFGGAREVFLTGEGEKAYETEIQSIIVSGPQISIMTKAGLFVNALKHLGFVVKTGDMTEYIGLTLELEEIKYNEAIQRFNVEHPKSKLPELTGENKDAKITMPKKIISMPVKKVSLEEAVMNVIEGKTEAEMVTWYKGTDIYDGTATTPLYRVLTELEKTKVQIVNDTYTVKKGTTA
jgi:hypothetical protein